jgi:pimeloyl-ACP methyl ester carboxylesterase
VSERKYPTVFKTKQGKTAVLQFYDLQIEKWNLPHETRNIKTRYGNTFILACGDKKAPPLILLHGGGMNSSMWLEDAEVYAKKFRVYAVDIPGEAGKSEEKMLPLTGAFYTEWLGDVFDELSIEIASMIGISFGAWLALKFSACYPERVNNLVLLSPLGVSPQKKFFLVRLVISMLTGKSGVDRLYRKINSNPAVSQSILDYQKLIGEHVNSRNELIPIFTDEEIQKCNMKVTMFVGEKDIIIHPAKTVSRLKSLLPNAQIMSLPDVGHVLMNLAGKIDAFLAAETVTKM